MADQSNSQQRLDLFIRLLPLSTQIAGLPICEPGRYYNEDQMELRAQAIKKAFRFAKILAREIAAEESTKSA